MNVRTAGTVQRSYKAAVKPPQAGVAMLLLGIRAHKWPTPETEIVFHPFRKWRLDVGWRDIKVAIEVDGGVYSSGRHTRGKGFEGDLEKINQAQLLGWRVFRYSTGQVKKGIYVDDLKRVFA